jgi:hypothetical protein
MPHNQLGEVDPGAYRKWLAILLSGNSARFAEVPRDNEAVGRLNNPQATYAIDLAGPDATALSLAPPPPFASQEIAAEMVELYWLALMRDVAFREYAGHPLTTAAISDLRAIGFGEFTPATLFRGETARDRRGPFVSQFLLREIPYGLKTVDQRFRVPTRGQSFLTTFDAWVACQRGCPTHPSYPAAHAVNAGACTTVLKAFFDEDFIIPDPVEATADGTRLEPWHGEALTLGGEIDKLAANIALARDAAGVHFRSDSIRGLRLGEAAAVGLLTDNSRTYNERFEGFVLTKFNGTRVEIANGAARTP